MPRHMEEEILDAEVLDDGDGGRTIPITVTGLGPGKPRERMLHVNGFALASVIAAGSALLLWWTLLPAPLAIIFALVARREIARTGQRGAKLARIGLIAGWVMFGMAVLVLLLLLVGATVSFLSGPHGVG